MILIGLLTLIEYVFGWNFGIDELLLGDSSPVTTFYPGRMGLNTAVNFVLVGTAINLLIHQKTRRSFWYAQILTLIAALISLQAVIGYAYNVKVLYGVAPYTTSMTLLTALTFIVVCAGILWSHPESGLMRVVTSDTDGGLLARRLLFAAIALPCVLGWLIVEGQRQKQYDAAFAVSMFAIIVIVSFVVLIWQSAALIEHLSLERDRAIEALKENEQKLMGFVDANVIGILFGDIYGGILQANDEFLRIIGYTREDLVAGRIDWIDITPPEYLHLDEIAIAEAKLTGACTPYEKEYIRPDNSRVSVVIGYTLLGEKREQSVAFILDLSDRILAEAALRRSEERFRLAIDNIPDVFGIYDAELRLQFVNAAGLQRTNKSLEEIKGRTDEEIFPPSITNAYLPTLKKALQTRTLQTVEATINLPDYVSTTLIKYVPILDEKGEIYQILGVTDDITVRKRAEEVLQNQQKWLEDAVNLMPTPLLFIEPKTARVTFANRAADELAGGKFPLAECVEDYYTTYYSTDAAGNPIPNEQAPGVRVARGERLDGVELNWHTPEGIRSLLIYADTLPAMHGIPATCVLTFQDITNLKRVEKALSLGYKRLQLLFGTASDLLSSQQPVTLLDGLFQKLAEQIGLDAYFNYLVEENELVLRLASYSGISEELAKDIEWLKFGQAVSGTVAMERRAISLENVQQSTDVKTELIRAVGITAYYGYPLVAQGRVLGTLSFASRSKDSFSQNEIGMMQAVCDQIAIAMERASLIASLQQQTEQLTEANRMKDEFLAILSHELRSPLNAILGWAQMLRSPRKLTETQTAKALETIERNARAQTQLIEDLLDISRMIRGKLRLNVRSCDLVPIIESALDSVGLAADAKEIHIETSINRNTELILGDSGRLQQIIWNLLSNAIKFTPQGGRVQVNLQRINSHVEITVSDTGIGIKPEFIPYVFDRFRQADSSSTRSHGGLGLGLSIVRHLVELHGGTVYVESAGVGKGAKFTVQLPLLNAKLGQTNTQNNTPAPPLSPSLPLPLSPSLRGVRVLVVDDEVDIRDFITTVLEQCAAEVQAVASVQEALEIITHSQPDVLISDIGMPEEDGYSLIRKVRSQPPDKGGNIPAAALTAYARAEDRMRAIQSGYQLHLPKPVEPAELATVVASLVGRT
ncbi:two-component hybrid sensor and regulator [Tolypothrix sp. NIES-4075]|nr:ATP-binding protein [Tolypothrix sp. NIES-4075]GAX43144.1 two-component hybrid sensor and regulator [Tolypothrix sp. NIES-4075]